MQQMKNFILPLSLFGTVVLFLLNFPKLNLDERIELIEPATKFVEMSENIDVQTSNNPKNTNQLNEEKNTKELTQTTHNTREEKILKNLKYKINIISFEAYIPNFYQNTVRIIEGIEKKFNSSFNLRKDYEYDFFLKNNVKSDQIKKILSKTSGVFEVFIFTD